MGSVRFFGSMLNDAGLRSSSGLPGALKNVSVAVETFDLALDRERGLAYAVMAMSSSSPPMMKDVAASMPIESGSAKGDMKSIDSLGSGEMLIDGESTCFSSPGERSMRSACTLVLSEAPGDRGPSLLARDHILLLRLRLALLSSTDADMFG